MGLQHNALLQHILERFSLQCDTSTISLKKMLRWKKSKTSGLWILVIALSREGSGRHGDEIRSGAVLLYLLLNKNMESFDTSIFFYPFSMISKKVCVQKLQFNVDGCVHRTKRNTLDNCWSNLWVWQLVYFDAFVFHGSAICFWTSDRDSSFLCSAPSYMP